MAKISLIIPMYNEERYIARCLDSLLEQTEKDFEVILIDDGSKDSSIAIAEDYKHRLDLTILQQQHGGPGRARNRWATQAKGEILVFVDADMSFDEHYLEELVKPIASNEEKWTAHGREYIANEENAIARAYGIVRLAYDPERPRGGVFRAIRKDIFLQQAGYDDSRYAFEDDMSEKVGHALYVPEAVCYHNNPESFNEIYEHEKRIGESLVAKGKLGEYLQKYKFLLSLFGLCVLIAITLAIYLEISFITLLLTIVCILAFLIMAVSINRAISERYVSHLIYVPAVMVTRWAGYIRGITHHLLSHIKKTQWN